MKNEELVSFNPVEREVSSLVELNDKELDQVVGGFDETDCPTNKIKTCPGNVE